MEKTNRDISSSELLAMNIKAFCELDNRTNEDLADRMGITPTQLSRYKNGGNEPRATMLLSIAKVLTIDIRRLFMTHNEWVNFINNNDKTRAVILANSMRNVAKIT